MLGKPDWDKAYIITIPFTAPEDGYIWVHLSKSAYDSLFGFNLVTPSGIVRGHTMCYGWGGSNFVPVNKGDTITPLYFHPYEDMKAFVPFRKD